MSRMQQDFDTTLNEFLAKVKTHLGQQADFVQHVNDALTAILESPNQNTPVPREPRVSAKVKKVLIVDDAELNRILMGHVFKNMSVVLQFASSGDQAIQKIAEQSFDIILMDLQMEGMSGVDAIKAIRNAQPENRIKTIIIAITDQDPTDEERINSMSAGANEYLSKKMSRDEIKERVFELVHQA